MGKGEVIMGCVLRNGSVITLRVLNVLHVPDLAHPLISWTKLWEQGYWEFGEGDYNSINKGTKVVFEAVFDGNLFKLPEISHSVDISFDFWRQALEHLAPSKMDKALQLYSDTKIPKRPMNQSCHTCVESTMTWVPRLSTVIKNRTKVELVHFDLSGPFSTVSYGHSLYYFNRIDHATRVACVQFMNQQSDTTNIIENFVAEMVLQIHKTSAEFRTDNGGELVTNDLEGFFQSKGIIHEFSLCIHLSQMEWPNVLIVE